MLTNEIRNQIDHIWNAFWSGGISNPLEVIEQITYLLFIKRLDELQTPEELKATRLRKPIERRLFPAGKDDHPWLGARKRRARKTTGKTSTALSKINFAVQQSV
jgi:HsdM N-terminal domain